MYTTLSKFLTEKWEEKMGQLCGWRVCLKAGEASTREEETGEYAGVGFLPWEKRASEAWVEGVTIDKRRGSGGRGGGSGEEGRERGQLK